MPKQKKSGSYRHLIQTDRDRIEALIDAGETQTSIAKILKVSAATISREIRKRQRKNGRYDAATAQMKAQVKRSRSKWRGMKIETDRGMKQAIIRMLRQKRSPDEIAGRMKRDRAFHISKNAVYRWLYSVYGQRYCKYLCMRRYRPKPRREHPARTMIPNRLDISLRPRGSENRSRYGHYEGDTIVAPKNVPNTEAVAIAADRKSKFIVGTRIPSLSASVMVGAMVKMEKEVVMKSCTLDNGIENKHHERWPVPAFFCEPHRPSQKPLIEGSIGLVRRWKFKKGTDWGKVSETMLQNMISFLNHQYRKSLKYESAFEVATAHAMIKMKPKD